MSKPPIIIAITGGAGNIAYSLLFAIARGELFGLDVPVALRILEHPVALPLLEAVHMELEDCAFPLLQEIRIGDDPLALFKDVQWALLVGAKPRSQGMERKDLLQDNGHIFAEQGKALNEVAARDVKVLVVGNPCNTNCLIAQHAAADLNAFNFYAMTRLDQNRARAFLAKKAGVSVKEVTRMAIWGNHSTTQVPDFYHAHIASRPLTETIADMHWLQNDFCSRLQKRGAEILRIRGKSSAASAASSIIDAVRSLTTATPKDDWFSMALTTRNNSYGLDSDLIFSFPCVSQGDRACSVVSHLEWNEFLETKIHLSEKELLEERDIIRNLLK